MVTAAPTANEVDNADTSTAWVSDWATGEASLVRISLALYSNRPSDYDTDGQHSLIWTEIPHAIYIPFFVVLIYLPPGVTFV